MKPTAVAFAFAVLAAPATAADLPYEQINIDRALPSVAERDAQHDPRASFRPTFEQYNP